jgi:hypothetical protein
MSGIGVGHVRGKLTRQLQNLQKLPKKLIFNEFWRRPIEYIYVWHMDKFQKTNHIYIWLEALES